MGNVIHDYGWVGVVDDIDNVVAGLLTLTNGSRRGSLPCPTTRRPICTWTLWLTYRLIFRYLYPDLNSLLFGAEKETIGFGKFSILTI